jgi:hypothetical protein
MAAGIEIEEQPEARQNLPPPSGVGGGRQTAYFFDGSSFFLAFRAMMSIQAPNTSRIMPQIRLILMFNERS